MCFFPRHGISSVISIWNGIVREDNEVSEKHLLLISQKVKAQSFLSFVNVKQQIFQCFLSEYVGKYKTRSFPVMVHHIFFKFGYAHIH